MNHLPADKNLLRILDITVIAACNIHLSRNLKNYHVREQLRLICSCDWHFKG